MFQSLGFYLRIRTILLVIGSIFLTTTISLAGSLEGKLFIPVSKDLSTKMRTELPALRATTIRQRIVQLNFDYFTSQIVPSSKELKRQQSIPVTLFDDVVIQLDSRDIEENPKGIYTWTSSVKADFFGSASITFGGGVAIGMVHIDDKIYEIQPIGENLLTISEIDQKKFPPEAIPIRPDEVASSTIKVLVVLPEPIYKFICGFKFPFPFNFNILDLVAKNYEKNLNGVFNRLFPTGVKASVVARCHDHQPVGGDLTEDLDWVRTDTNIAALRDELKADLVSFIVPEASFCGMAYQNFPVTNSSADFGFSVVVGSCSLSNYSFAHELGHNIGMGHDRVADIAAGSSDCNYGYVFTKPKGRTVMAFSSSCDGCTRYGLYSTPKKFTLPFIGTLGPFGVACDAPASGSTYSRANNRGQLITAAPVVSAFR